jgi:ferredoxin--NADP+ reductase
MTERREKPGWSHATIARRVDWHAGLMTLVLDVEPSFEAGQFFNLGLDLHDSFERRAYSAASRPGAALEFFVAQVAEGVFSPALFALRTGDRIWVENRAQGFFTLRYVPPARHLWCVASGTGLGPFIAMLRSDSTWQRFERIVLVHGVRGPEQLAYTRELERMKGQRPLTMVRCVSRASPRTGELGGRATSALERGELERAAELGLSPQDSHVMLCGNPQMVGDMMALLKERGLVRHRQRKPVHVTIEKYW